MAEFNIQSDSVDVTRIMEQIRQRIQEKRGRDYTEQQIRELATVKLERFLDPQQVRSDLVAHYRQLTPSEPFEPTPPESPSTPELFDFDEHTIYASSRGTMGKLIRLIRKLLHPMLKLFFNPTPVVFALTRQAEINAWTLQLLQRQTDLAERVGKRFAAREELDALNYEVLNNLVVEMTRLSVDMKNHRSLVESVAGRLDFDERRARALESVVQSRSPQPPQSEDGEHTASTGSGRTRRRRRRPRRRAGTTVTPDAGKNNDTEAVSGAQGATAQSVPPPDTATRPVDTAASHTGAPPRHGAAPVPVVEPSAPPSETTPPPPAAAPSPNPEPTTPAVPPVADTGASNPPPTPPTPGQRDAPAPAPATVPATETVAPTSPTGDGTDEQ